MFLRNYDNYMAAANLTDSLTANSGGTNNSTAVFGDGYYNQKAASGTITTIYFCDGSAQLHGPITLSTKGICLGTGGAAVSYEDYRLSGDVVPNKLVEVSKSTTYDATTHKFKKTLVATYTNSGSTDITISEWGLWRHNNESGGGTLVFDHASNQATLTYRAVLSKPIVIEAGTTATLTFSIDVPMPNHP